MFETKSGLRTIATLITAAALTIAATTPAQAAVSYSKTVSYISAQFVDGKYVVGFTAGKADYGMTLEAMLQLLAAGKDAKAQAVAVSYNLKSTAYVGLSAKKTGALYTPDNRLKLGDAGKFLFTFAALKQSANTLYKDVLASVKASIAADGSTPGDQNVYTSSWLVLGLKAIKQNALAEKVAVKLASLSVPKTGGFADDQVESANTASPDATGIALQALAASKGLGTKSEETSKSAAINGARAWIKSIAQTDANGSFVNNWGDWNANSTEYVAMGLKATGSNISAYAKWIASKISAADNGIQAGSWTNGAGNAYATIQGYVPLIGKSYLDLIK